MEGVGLSHSPPCSAPCEVITAVCFEVHSLLSLLGLPSSCLGFEGKEKRDQDVQGKEQLAVGGLHVSDQAAESIVQFRNELRTMALDALKSRKRVK